MGRATNKCANRKRDPRLAGQHLPRGRVRGGQQGARERAHNPPWPFGSGCSTRALLPDTPCPEAPLRRACGTCTTSWCGSRLWRQAQACTPVPTVFPCTKPPPPLPLPYPSYPSSIHPPFAPARFRARAPTRRRRRTQVRPQLRHRPARCCVSGTVYVAVNDEDCYAHLWDAASPAGGRQTVGTSPSRRPDHHSHGDGGGSSRKRAAPGERGPADAPAPPAGSTTVAAAATSAGTVAAAPVALSPALQPPPHQPTRIRNALEVDFR